ncbi:MAG: sulfur transferase domain-containing protein [Gemmatimonadota bacterium]
MDDAQMRKIVELLPYGGCPLADVATAGQPDAAAWGELAKAGFKSVIDLREASESRGHDEPGAIARAGLTYILLPVSHESLGDRQFDALREFLRDPGNRPALVHCQSANRVGALMLPYLRLDEHIPLDTAQQMANVIGLRSPDYAALALDYVRRHASLDD